MRLEGSLTVALLASINTVSGQAVNTVWSSVVFTYRGEQEPLFSNTLSAKLTSLGANQAYAAGAYLRSRYLVTDNTQNATHVGLRDMGLNIPNNDQINVISTDDEGTINSAQAFLQALYPPLVLLQSTALTQLADGTLMQYPLNGYQYVPIESVSELDWNYIWLAGSDQCINYQLSANTYQISPQFATTSASSSAVYASLAQSIFSPLSLSTTSMTYSYAYSLWEYANYQYNHNATAKSQISQSQLNALYALASTKMFALTGNLTASGASKGDMVRAISGKTMAYKVVQYLSASILSGGSANKLNLMFGSFEPFLAFFALSGLASYSPSPSNSLAFQQIPLPGSTIIFELFSSTPSSYNLSQGMPAENNLWVRFMFRNGTDDASRLVSYPLFGRGNSESDMAWKDFKTLMQGISINNIGDWCNICGGTSTALFCPLFVKQDGSTNVVSTIPTASTSASGNAGLSPIIAGFIGAIIMFVVMGIVLVVVSLNSRWNCVSMVSRRRRPSTLGGFKGADRMKSDIDVSIMHVGSDTKDIKGLEDDTVKINASESPRKERVGSWEMRTPTSPPPAWTQHDSNKSPGIPSASSWRDHDDEFDFGAKPVAAFERV